MTPLLHMTAGFHLHPPLGLLPVAAALILVALGWCLTRVVIVAKPNNR